MHCDRASGGEQEAPSSTISQVVDEQTLKLLVNGCTPWRAHQRSAPRPPARQWASCNSRRRSRIARAPSAGTTLVYYVGRDCNWRCVVVGSLRAAPQRCQGRLRLRGGLQRRVALYLWLGPLSSAPCRVTASNVLMITVIFAPHVGPRGHFILVVLHLCRLAYCRRECERGWMNSACRCRS